MITRTGYAKIFIGIAIGNLIGILIYTYLSGQPWSAFISWLAPMFAGLAFVVLLTWGTWTKKQDDAKEN